MRRSVVSCVVALYACVGCGYDAGPDIVLVTLDTTRADRLGAMGNANARTPTLDGVAAGGVVFERAYASAPLTLPSHATILTGLDPDQHGIHDNGRFVLPASVPTVAERLAARGYDTAAFVAAVVLDASFGLDRGFARYDDDITSARDPLRFEVPRRRGEEVTQRALTWLDERGRRPFFLWVHYYDVHLPRQPPPPFDAMSDAYDGALSYVDAQIGRLLERVKRADRGRPTMVVVVGDHGEGLGEHDEETHGVLAYDATLHVPLIVAGPGFAAGRRSAAFVRTIDIAPTMLAAAGASPVESTRGQPLQTRTGPGGDDTTIGYFECFGPSYRMGWGRLGGVRTARWKLTAEPEPAELYDTATDPYETVNRAAAEPAVVADLRARWNALRPPDDESQRPASVADDQLAALGYIDVRQSFPRGQEPDPRTSVAALALVDAARDLALQGKVPESIRALELLASSPVAYPLALASLGPLYLLADRPADALGVAELLAAASDGLPARLLLVEALSAVGRDADALRALDASGGTGRPATMARLERAEILLRLGRAAEAASEAALVLETNPWDDLALALGSRANVAEAGADVERQRLEALLRAAPEPERLLQTRAVLANLQRDAGRDVDAVRTLEAVADPPPEYRVMLAEIAAAHGNAERAAALYTVAIGARPAAQRWRRRLADVDAILGRLDEALAQYDRMLEVDPANAALLVERGSILARLHRATEAEQSYRDAIALDGTLPEAFLDLALLELASAREADAEAHLLRALELRPDYRKAHFHLARLYGRRGDPRARDHAEEVVGPSPGDGTRIGSELDPP